jgi:hypothetical protein
MSLFSLNEQTWRTDGAPTTWGRAEVRNGQNLSERHEWAAKQMCPESKQTDKN